MQISLPSDYDPSASVDALKSVGGDGVLYFATHGAFWGNGTLAFPLTFAVATSTPADPIRNSLYANDLQITPARPRNLVVYVPEIGGGVSVPRYGITAAFVKTYWTNFSDNSFVYISACSSDDPRPSTNGIVPPGGKAVAQSAQDFKQAVLSKHVSVYAGWSSDVTEEIAVGTDLLCCSIGFLARTNGTVLRYPIAAFAEANFLRRQFQTRTETRFTRDHSIGSR